MLYGEGTIYEAGEIAVKILKGEATPADMPIEYLSSKECKLIVNTTTADTLRATSQRLSSPHTRQCPQRT